MVQIGEEDFRSDLTRALSSCYYAELRDRLDAIAEPPSPGELAAPEGRFLVARIEAEPVGCIGLRRLDRGLLEAKHLFVDPAQRGTGVGRALLAAAEEHARRLGARRVVLDTAAVLGEAIALYRSAGYDEIAPYNDNPHAQLWFEKRLTDGLFAEVRAGAAERDGTTAIRSSVRWSPAAPNGTSRPAAPPAAGTSPPARSHAATVPAPAAATTGQAARSTPPGHLPLRLPPPSARRLASPR